jgi:hypothetical protein
VTLASTPAAPSIGLCQTKPRARAHGVTVKTLELDLSRESADAELTRETEPLDSWSAGSLASFDAVIARLGSKP